MIYQKKRIRILHEDKDILVIHKEAGVASETKKLGEQDCVTLAKNYLAEKNRSLKKEGKETEAPWIGLVHRLDQPVEGILVMAKNKEAAASLSEQIKNGEMYKEYMALVIPHVSVLSIPKDDSIIRLTDYLYRDPKKNRSFVVKEGAKDAKIAELEYSRAEADVPIPIDRADLLKIRLFTGRHHQIRVQLSYAGIPVVGDRKYGVMPDRYRGPLCLAARKLTFRHPATNEQVTYELKASELDFLKQ